ncbi:DUF3566 domain-containing protein [Klenkia taihuensis]|uniref:DUF3566 domain-containing protein n=1 Tax=Klenkia taihuensis TaxID=1225127 RepID=A0A1I1GN77_9ACTN|nr:DUF3566 domain-containing protein [Klenkia taihuensis]GHE09645.1 hypothetical protein GCM10011381_15440 [Klenkia taihuensis]SFC12915.1 Transmembrane protein of unknown function [Klenkia taihuensis]
MSDRTQGSVQTDDAGAATDPETKAIPTEKPGSAPSAAPAAAPETPAAGSTSASSKPSGNGNGGKPSGKPAVAPGWGGAAPTGTAQAASARPAGQPPAGPTQPAAPTQQPAKKSAPAADRPAQAARPTGQQPAARPADQRPAAAAAAAAGAAAPRVGAAQTGVRPANRDAGAPRQTANRPPAGARVAEAPARPAASEQGERTGVRGAVKGGKGPRRARLQLRHIDTWSALKISLVLAIALFFVWMVAVGVLYGVLSGLGVFSTLNDLIGQLGSASGDSTGEVITPGIVFGGAAVIGAVNIVLFTALCTVGTFVYNLCADLVGGLEVTLSERDS